ncbi:ABC transporter ATP-binding protein [Leifsonia sp. NPDC058248]|uniref:ABC transporter ATP-binding protein n=1 Tax=Leifsonia sp. NPDC058248 TaxID=3346402 RepID=UPI0036D8B061
MPIEVRDLEFRYEDRSPMFLDYSVTFQEGEMVALTGASGRGKSTLLYLLGLMLKPIGGTVLVDGVDSSVMSDADRARLRATRFGFVFQDAALDATRSVLDNVVESVLYRCTSRRAARPLALSLMREFGVEARPEAKPGQLSGGQAQRIALCRALLHKPSFVLADEPTGNLDSDSGGVVIEALKMQARSGAVVLVATHDSLLVNQCDRIVAL